MVIMVITNYKKGEFVPNQGVLFDEVNKLLQDFDTKILIFQNMLKREVGTDVFNYIQSANPFVSTSIFNPKEKK